MEHSNPLRRAAALAIKWLIRMVVACVLIVATLLLAEAFADRRLPDLEAWHTTPPELEFRASDAGPGFTFKDYLHKEDQLFKSLAAYQISPDDLRGHSRLIRYVAGGPNTSAAFRPDWNRTSELVPENIVGGVLLLHGLSDSPYSMRSLAERFHKQGCYALCLRLPGHGTVPAGLLNVSWKDWVAAVRLAVAHVRQRIGPGKPLYLCGYSNGGALAVLYALEAIETGGDVPDRMFLFSPAIGITAFAQVSNWHKLYSWMPYFQKSTWLSVEPEYDPFKYCSFTKNAGRQVWAVTRAIQEELLRAETDGRVARLPPIMTFQSMVDSTIIAACVVSRLYGKLPANGSELVVFDVNRAALLDGFYRRPHEALDELLRSRSLPYAVTVVQNASPDSRAAVARRKPAMASEFRDEPLGLEWPPEVYSLAHVAIPFPPDDPVYGAGGAVGGPLCIGDLSLRGEKHVLRISAEDLLRLRHNPFHAYMLDRMSAAIGGAAPDS